MHRTLPPKRLRSATVDFFTGDLRTLARRYIKKHRLSRDSGATAFVYGPEGVGKSGWAASIHVALASKGWLIGWMDCNDWPGTWDESREAMVELTRVQALVLDDVGREPKGMRQDVARLITRRFNEGLWTIYTSNLNIDEQDSEACDLSRYYSRALRSRLLGQADVIFMDGTDRREPNA